MLCSVSYMDFVRLFEASSITKEFLNSPMEPELEPDHGDSTDNDFDDFGDFGEERFNRQNPDLEEKLREECKCTICTISHPLMSMQARFSVRKVLDGDTKQIRYNISSFTWPLCRQSMIYGGEPNQVNYHDFCNVCFKHGWKYFHNIIKTDISPEHLTQLTALFHDGLVQTVLGYLDAHVCKH